MTSEQHSSRSENEPPEDDICVDGYPEHDWVEISERDGISTYECQRCGAETWEKAPDA